jgi:predicted nucleotide-binding protein (sugar kinase/HSP70/actin superfamily)
MPDLTDFMLYCAYGAIFKHAKLSGTFKAMMLNRAAIAAIEFYRKHLRRALKKSSRFEPPSNIYKLAEEASKILSTGTRQGRDGS